MARKSQAQAAPGLELSSGEGTEEQLRFDDAEELNCRFVLPDGWLVTPDDSAEAAFDEAEIFAEMGRRYYCYDPENRDRCEIEFFAAQIIPERVGLAALYAQVLARVWGPEKHGTAAHSPLFGEALTGGDWYGQSSRTRISVWRRGNWLLILRSRYRTESEAAYAGQVAGIVGSLSFAADFADPITEALIADPLEMSDGQIVTMRPEWWRDPGFAAPPESEGLFRFWVDEADEDRNSAAMLTTQAFEPVPDDMAGPPEDMMAKQADGTLDFMLTNLVPGQSATRTPTSTFTLGRTENAIFDRSYVYKLEFSESGAIGIAQVTQALTRDGRLVVSAVFTLAPLSLDQVAPHLHTTWFENQINTAVATFLAERTPFS